MGLLSCWILDHLVSISNILVLHGHSLDLLDVGPLDAWILCVDDHSFCNTCVAREFLLAIGDNTAKTAFVHALALVWNLDVKTAE